MTNVTLPILRNSEVNQRVSSATRAVLDERAHPAQHNQFLDDESLDMLREVVEIILPQDRLGTHVHIAESIDRRLAEGKNSGWRFAALPPDGQAYREGLAALRRTLAATPMKAFEHMPSTAREAYLRCVANGEADDAARFPLSTFFAILRGDIVRIWMSHPDTMAALQLYSFATGTTGRTNGPTDTEGWQEITPDTAQPFEHDTLHTEREG